MNASAPWYNNEVNGAALRTRLDDMFRHIQENGFTQETVARIKDIILDFQPENGGHGKHRPLLRATNSEFMRIPPEQL